MIHRFADEILLILTGERGVFDTKIAFVQSQGKAKEIFIADFDGGNPVQVTRDQNLNLSPRMESRRNADCLRELQGREHQDLRG